MQQVSTSTLASIQMSFNLGIDEDNSLINLCSSMVSKRPQDGVKELGGHIQNQGYL
jgi:hypothetical protein